MATTVFFPGDFPTNPAPEGLAVSFKGEGAELGAENMENDVENKHRLGQWSAHFRMFHDVSSFCCLSWRLKIFFACPMSPRLVVSSVSWWTRAPLPGVSRCNRSTQEIHGLFIGRYPRPNIHNGILQWYPLNFLQPRGLLIQAWN